MTIRAQRRIVHTHGARPLPPGLPRPGAATRVRSRWPEPEAGLARLKGTTSSAALQATDAAACAGTMLAVGMSPKQPMTALQVESHPDGGALDIKAPTDRMALDDYIHAADAQMYARKQRRVH